MDINICLKIPLRSIEYDFAAGSEVTCSWWRRRWWWYNRRVRFWLSLRPSLAISVTGTASNNPTEVRMPTGVKPWVFRLAREYASSYSSARNLIYTVSMRLKKKKKKEKRKRGWDVYPASKLRSTSYVKTQIDVFFIHRYHVSVFLWKFFDIFFFLYISSNEL